jgi:hypothetical protein
MSPKNGWYQAQISAGTANVRACGRAGRGTCARGGGQGTSSWAAQRSVGGQAACVGGQRDVGGREAEERGHACVRAGRRGQTCKQCSKSEKKKITYQCDRNQTASGQDGETAGGRDGERAGEWVRERESVWAIMGDNECDGVGRARWGREWATTRWVKSK